MNALRLADDFEWRREEDLGRLRDEALRDRERALGALHTEAIAEQEKRDITYDQFQSLGFVTPPTAAGVNVTQMTAFQVSAWWCGINVIAGDLAGLDFDLYRRAGDDDREKVSNHPVAKILAQPNEFMVPMIFWQTLMAHVLGWGNAYAEIEWDQAMRPIALWPIMPNEIEPIAVARKDARGRKTTTIAYRYRGQEPLIAAEDILHIPGLGFDGIRGYSVVSLARQSLGLSLATERFGGSFFGNGAWPGLVLEHPRQLSTPAIERLKASVEDMHRGADRAFKLFIAEEGMKVARPVTVNPNDAQAVETREHQIAEIARWLKLPPHKLMHAMGERPGGNLESSETDYHITTLLPWTTLIAQLCNRKLISTGERPTYYTEHNYGRRLQPTPIQRMAIQQGYQKMGVLTPEQIARLENLPKPEAKAQDLTLKEKIDAVGQLIRAGFDPEGSLQALALPVIAHTGLVPVTVKEEGQPAPFGGRVTERIPIVAVVDASRTGGQGAGRPALETMADRALLPAPAPPAPAAPPAVDPPAPDPAAADLIAAPPSSRAKLVTTAQRALLTTIVTRYIRREGENAKRASKRGAAAFGEWVDTFYAAGEGAVLRESLEPAVALCLATSGSPADPRTVAEAFSERHQERSKTELLELRAKDLETAVPALLKKWETSRVIEGVEELMAALDAAEEKEHVA